MDTPSNKLFELKLFHHYMQMPQKSIQWQQDSRPKHTLQGVWKQWIASLAMKDDTLMDALLAFSAASLRILCPSDRWAANASSYYMLRTITSHARQVRYGINPQNAEVLFATSTFIALSASMTPAGEVSGPPLHVSVLLYFSSHLTNHLAIQWFRTQQGTRAIAEAASWDGFQNTKIKHHLIADYANMVSFVNSPNTGQLEFDFLLDDLRLDDIDAEVSSAYQRAVAHLNLLNRIPVPRYILRFPAMVSQRFIELIAAEDPRTLCIVGYFFMLVGKVGDLWWMRGQAAAEFKALMKLIPKEWQSKMSWAVRVFEQEEVGPI